MYIEELFIITVWVVFIVLARNYNGNKDTYKSGKNKGRVVKDVYREQVLRSLNHNNYQFDNDYILNRKTT